MVLAIEPGCYIDGGGGLRVEDNFLITETARRSCPPSRTGSCRHEEVASQRGTGRRLMSHGPLRSRGCPLREPARCGRSRGSGSALRDNRGVRRDAARRARDRHRLRDRAAALAVSYGARAVGVVAGDARRGARERPRLSRPAETFRARTQLRSGADAARRAALESPADICRGTCPPCAWAARGRDDDPAAFPRFWLAPLFPLEIEQAISAPERLAVELAEAGFATIEQTPAPGATSVARWPWPSCVAGTDRPFDLLPAGVRGRPGACSERVTRPGGVRPRAGIVVARR